MIIEVNDAHHSSTQQEGVLQGKCMCVCVCEAIHLCPIVI